MTWTSEALGWAPQVLAIELKKALTYRVTFWIRHILGTLTELTIAYFLWEALFARAPSGPGIKTLAGYSFHGILYYYLFAALGSRVVWGSLQGSISTEIYDGSLNRYLLYPLSFSGYKCVALFAQQLIASSQLLFGLAVAISIWGNPQSSRSARAASRSASSRQCCAGSRCF